MNIRKMNYTPKIEKKPDLKYNADLGNMIIWNYGIYEVLVDHDDRLEWSCRNCDADKRRIAGHTCPDNDKCFDWRCMGPNGESKILIHRGGAGIC